MSRKTGLRYAIYRGITTGLNEAFIIDNQTKEGLIAQDPRSEDILKPVLRGRDIERYRAKWAGRWLIDTHNGYVDVPPIDIDDYPAVKTYLDCYYEQLASRYDKGGTPYNLRNCAYYEDFGKEKLLWIELVDKGRFAYDNTGIFGEASSFMMTGESMKFLLAVLNSALAHWYLGHTAPTSGMGTPRWKKIYVEAIPVPKTSLDEQQPVVGRIEQILSLMKQNPDADVSALEAEIDRLVYALYGLTEQEIASVTLRV